MTGVLKKIRHFVWENKIYFLSFIIPFIIVVITFYQTKVYPFGDYSYLMNDSREQYAPFLEGFYNKIKEGSSLAYTWNIGLGSGYGAVYAYYLASPFNWLIFLLPQSHLLDAVDLLILLKLSLCGVTFSYYLSKKFNTKNMTVAVIAICYALSSYICQYGGNIIWLDCLMLFPLIILGVERLYKEHKHGLYFFSLAISIISNYYISIMICIFLVLYFIMLLLTDSEHRTIRDIMIKVRYFLTYSLLAGGVACAVLFPAIAALGMTESGEFSFPKSIELYSSLSDLAMRTLITVPKDIRDYYPNLYCSVIVLLLIPMYLCNAKINRRRKIGNLSLAVFMLLSFEVNVLDYLWNGFHFTNCLFARNSFIYIFLVLVMSYEALLHLKELPDKRFVICIAGSLLYILLLWKLKIGEINGEIQYREKIAYLTLIFVFLYLMIFLFYRGVKFDKKPEKGKEKAHQEKQAQEKAADDEPHKKTGKRYRAYVSYTLLLLLVAYELYMNAGEAIYSTCTRSDLLNDNQAVRELVEKAEKEENGDFFRMEKEQRHTVNDGEKDNYPGVSQFASTANAGVTAFCKSVGLENFTNYYSYDGHTPLISSIFAVRYILSDEKLEENEEYELVDEADFYSSYYMSKDKSYQKIQNTMYLYKNKYALPLGFMVAPEFEEAIDLEDENPFEVLNRMYSGITGSSEQMFQPLKSVGQGENKIFEVTSAGRVYFKSSISPYSMAAVIKEPDGNLINRNFSYAAYSYITDLGVLEEGSIVGIGTDEAEGEYEVYAYRYNEELIKEAYETLKASGLKVDQYEETVIKGSVEAKKDGLLFTSIPYEKGWRVRVDGKRVKTHSFKNAFLSVYLEEGEHTLEFSYVPPEGGYGIIVSAISLLLYVVLQIVERKRSGRKQQR